MLTKGNRGDKNLILVSRMVVFCSSAYWHLVKFHLKKAF